MTLRKVAEFAGDYFTSAKLDAIEHDLQAIRDNTEEPAHPPSAATPAPPLPASEPLGITSKIGDLTVNPATKAVLERHIGAMMASQQFAMARGITLKQLQAYTKDALIDEVLQAIATDLAQVATFTANHGTPVIVPDRRQICRRPIRIGDGWHRAKLLRKY